MEVSTIVAGFGGQGVMLTGKLLSRAAHRRGWNVTYYPTYGAEMRGGTATCTVIISDEQIGSPEVDMPDSLIAFNEPSFRKYASSVKESGVIYVNSSLVKRIDVRDCKARIIEIPATETAFEIGNSRVANIVMLGSFACVNGVLNEQDLLDVILEISKKNEKLLADNKRAFNIGTQSVCPNWSKA